METGKRQKQLIADFVNGYADGWHMAVKECYRNQLDIKFTERKKNNKPYFEWTQGPYYSFAEGHLFYDTPKAYKKWNQAIKAIKIVCKITSATPTMLDKNKNLLEGVVNFTIYKANKQFESLIAAGDYKVSQKGFVNFLKIGRVDEHSIR